MRTGSFRPKDILHLTALEAQAAQAAAQQIQPEIPVQPIPEVPSEPVPEEPTQPIKDQRRVRIQ